MRSLRSFSHTVVPFASAVNVHCYLGGRFSGDLGGSVTVGRTCDAAGASVYFFLQVVVSGLCGFHAGQHLSQWFACFGVLIHLHGIARPFVASAPTRSCTGFVSLAGDLQPSPFSVLFGCTRAVVSWCGPSAGAAMSPISDSDVVAWRRTAFYGEVSSLYLPIAISPRLVLPLLWEWFVGIVFRDRGSFLRAVFLSLQRPWVAVVLDSFCTWFVRRVVLHSPVAACARVPPQGSCCGCMSLLSVPAVPNVGSCPS